MKIRPPSLQYPPGKIVDNLDHLRYLGAKVCNFLQFQMDLTGHWEEGQRLVPLMTMSGKDDQPKASDELVKEYGGIIHSIARRMLQDSDKVREATQEAWLEVTRSLPAFKGNSKLSTWIYRIATRVVMDYAKHEQIYSTRFMRSFFALNSSSLPVTYFYNLNEECRQDKSIWVKERCNKCLTGFLHCLKNEARLALILRDVAGISYGEIARILEKEEPAVRQLVSRSRRRVISFLDDNCVLYNPRGKCRCHLKKQVLEIDLPNEYEKLRASVQELNVFTAMDQFLPPANLWEI